MTMEERVALWDAINAYTEACGGDPSKHVYGNTTRQKAVAEVERLVRQVERQETSKLTDCERNLQRAVQDLGALEKLRAHPWLASELDLIWSERSLRQTDIDDCISSDVERDRMSVEFLDELIALLQPGEVSRG